jgi:hypothetical protein
MIAIDGEFDVLGASAALAYFRALQPGALSHGYLFTGPAGIGKKTFARRVAQSLLCETPKTTLLGYCNHCTGCTLFVAGTHPDFVASEGTIKIGKDGGSALHDEDLTARDLVRELSLHGYRGAYRVVLLGDVAFATHEAANALLKFFEEPPRGVIVLLTTSAPGTLLATIRSRFVEIGFPPLAARDVQQALTREGVPEERALVGEMLEVVRIAARDWAALGAAGSSAPLLAPDQRALWARIPRRSPAAVAGLLGAVAEVARLAESNVSAGLVVEHLRMQLAPPPAQ